MTDSTGEQSVQERWADKINKLLAKAEAAGTEAEAETFRVKAEELIIKWGIEDAMLESLRGVKVDTIGQRRLNGVGIFGKAHYEMAYRIGVTGFGFRGFVTTQTYSRDDAGNKVMGYATWVGYESDLTKAEMLFTSLQVQLSKALAQFTEEWKKEWGRKLPKHELYKSRRAFITAFGNVVANRIRSQRRQAVIEAQAEQDAKAHPVGTPKTSVSLVLVTREEQVKEFFDQKYGRLRIGRATSRGVGIGGTAAGAAAGAAANLGGGGAIGSRKSIGK